MYDAYHRIFDRCALTFRPVEAQAGEIGGDVNHEFMAVAAVGEDDFVWCRSCDYAANVEAARRDHAWHHTEVPAVDGARGATAGASGGEQSADAPEMEKVHTPDVPGIVGVAVLLGADPSDLLKCIAFDVDGEVGLALVPGDREVNTYALAQALPGRSVRLLEDDDFERRTDIPKGYLGPHFAGAVVVVADPSVRRPGGWMTGANEVDHHVRNAVLGRDFDVQVWAELVTIVTGDACPRCGEQLSVDRGIEVGHVFQLGTKYTEVLDARYTDDAGESHPMVMGCYGIGVSRVVAAIVEEHHDDAGIAWPAALAPYDVHLIVLPGRGDVAAEVTATADSLYDDMRAAGLEVLYDDRDQSPGVKFADADLLGMPVQLVLGAKGFQRGVVERKVRATGERTELALTDDLLTVSPAELRAAVIGGAA